MAKSLAERLSEAKQAAQTCKPKKNAKKEKEKG
jgi:hypothetical protein